jgi:hypothetical protein
MPCRHGPQPPAPDPLLVPMILRLRQLRHQGSLEQARCLEQELLPLF